MNIIGSCKRILCAALAGLMIFTNVVPAIPAYAAISRTAPVNPDGTTPTGNKSKDEAYKVNKYVEDAPLRLSVSKVKTDEGEHEGIDPKTTPAPKANTVTYKVSGRVDGSRAALLGKYGSNGIELAYNGSGMYLGYGWLPGTKEYLESRKALGTDAATGGYIDIMYNNYGIFEGYAYVTHVLETADDVNRYVAGAQMILYDAIEIFRNAQKTGSLADYETDDRFRGVTVIRDAASNNVTNVYINKGFAGTETMYVLQKDNKALVTVNKEGRIVEIDKNYDFDDEINDTGSGVWTVKEVQRGDTVYPAPPAGEETIGTPILYYSLDNLHCTDNDRYYSVDLMNRNYNDSIYGSERLSSALYGFDKEGNVVNVSQFDELDFSLFVFADGKTKPVFEICGGDYEKVIYDNINKRFTVGKNTVIYHLDSDGNRDAMVDPQTGIAYIEQPTGPMLGSHPGSYGNIHDDNDVTTLKDETQTKIFVWPVNVFYDTTGAGGSKTFEKIATTRIATINADTAEEYTTGTYEAGAFNKTMVPKLDKYGHVIYYSVSPETYVKGADITDYDGDYLGYGYSDALDSFNEASYWINTHSDLYNGDADNPFNQKTHYTDSTNQDISVLIYGNHVINGSTTVPTPSRDGYAFAGWLVEPSDIAAGTTTVAKAYWRAKGTVMSEEEKDKWYSVHSDEAALATAFVVTFDANGGKFYAGGDPHSTDKKLYHRLGDALIMNNSWITGEKYPNDPTAGVIVDTVENKAAGTNTVTAGEKTYNDVYESGAKEQKNGGNADMLKRVPAGHYIMEELKAPLGYVKAMPSGVTVNEMDAVQTAKMTDTTVKVELDKVDGPIEDEYDLFVDGAIQKDVHDKNIKVTESKGSFTYYEVPGAVIEVTGRDAGTKDQLSAWVKVTDNTKITKVNEGGEWHFTFETGAPLYVEGLPSGNYKLSEIVTPKGYVTMPDRNIVIGKDSVPDVFRLTDDHTKVEVFKYYLDNDTKRILPNSYRAHMELLNEGGSTVAAWVTDDLSDYTGNVPVTTTSFFGKILQFLGLKEAPKSFVETFRDAVEGNPNLSSIGWEVLREAVKLPRSTSTDEYWLLNDGLVVHCDGTVPLDTESGDPIPAGFAAAYAARSAGAEEFSYNISKTASRVSSASPDLNNQIWETSDGAYIHVSVYPKNDGGKYTADFKFNFRSADADPLPGAYSEVISYDTVEGYHRFDYLPADDAGTKYVIRETKAPGGFMVGDDKEIIVNRTEAVQRFTFKNERKRLLITKAGTADSVNFYAGFEDGAVITTTDLSKAAVISGATIKVFYSAAKIPSADQTYEYFAESHAGVDLIDTFVTGTDGVYTEEDYHKGNITVDQIGDYKPHSIQDLNESGFYYIVETEVPDYYERAQVLEIDVSTITKAEQFNVRPVDKAQPLKIRIKKTDESGTALEGAVFEITNVETGAVTGTVTTDAAGEGTLLVTEGTVRLSRDGALVPYTYRAREITPPKGYKTNKEVYEFTVSPDKHDGLTVIYNPSEAAISGGVLTVEDEETSISITPQDFDDGSIVEGKELSVYSASFDGTKWVIGSAQEDPATWSWTTDTNPDGHRIRKAVAGETYALVETKVPAGYTIAKPVFFKVSSDGHYIEKMWTDETENPYVRFEADEDDAVDKVYISSKAILSVVFELEDEATHAVKSLGGTTGDFLLLTSEDIAEGKKYSVREIVRYTDGTEDVISTVSFMAALDATGKEKVKVIESPEKLTVTVTDEDGKVIFEKDPDGSPEILVENPLREDKNSLEIVSYASSQIGADHKAITSGKVIIYQIKYGCGKDKEIVIEANSKLNYSTVAPFVYDAGTNTYRYTTTADSGELEILTSLKEGSTGNVLQKVYIDGALYSYLSPIAVNGGAKGTIWEHTSKLLVTSDVTGTHPLNDSAVFSYDIKLTKTDGTPLDGSYAYSTGTGSGVLDCFGSETEFRITLSGDDYFVICDLPYHTQYEVKQTASAGDRFVTTVKGTKAGETLSTDIASVLFRNKRNAPTDRTLFTKDDRYTVSYTLKFKDHDDLTVKRFAFRLSDLSEIENLSILNKKTKIEFSKADLTDAAELSGATCCILYEDGTPVLDGAGNELKWVSDGGYHLVEGILEAGKTYIYKEIAPPDGYGYCEGDSVRFTVSETGVIDRVVMTDRPTEIKIIKTDEKGDPIQGAVLTILDEDKKAVKALRDYKPEGSAENLFEEGADLTFTSSLSGTEITGQLNADTKYFVHEITPPAGYKYSKKDVPFTVDHNGYLVTATMKDEPTVGKFMKVDGEGNPIAGATLVIRDAVTKEVIYGPWNSTDDWLVLTGVLSVDKEYELVELVSPKGFYLSESEIFILNEDGEIEVKMKDDPIKLKVVKYNADGTQKLKGAKFTVLSEDRKTVIPVVAPNADGIPEETEEFTVDEEILLIGKNLEAGKKIYIHETEAPSGYVKSSDIEIVVPFYKPADMEAISVSVYNTRPQGGGGDDPVVYPYTLRIFKYDGTTGAGLKGAEFAVFNGAGVQVATIVTDYSGIAVFHPTTKDKYSVRETKAPDGYRLIDTTFEADLTTENIKVVNVPNYQIGAVVIKKIDADTGEPLPGAVLEVMTDKGDVVLTEETDENGEISFIPTYYGNYVCYEVKAPEGYRFRDRSEYYITFTVTEGGVAGTLEFLNSKFLGKVDLFYTWDYPRGRTDGWVDRDNVFHEWDTPPIQYPLGDNFPFLLLGISALILLAAGIIIGKKKTEKSGRKNRRTAR